MNFCLIVGLISGLAVVFVNVQAEIVPSSGAINPQLPVDNSNNGIGSAQVAPTAANQSPVNAAATSQKPTMITNGGYQISMKDLNEIMSKLRGYIQAAKAKGETPPSANPKV